VHECDDLTEARAIGVARVHVDLRCVQPDPFETVMDRGMRLTIGEVGIALPEHAAVQMIAAARPEWIYLVGDFVDERPPIG
jgi:hypothetical protein